MDWYTLDCGHGNMTILEQNGEKLAIDAGSLNDDEGSNPLETDEGSNPLETDESVKLDNLVITHLDADHIEGIVDLYTDNDVEFGTIWIPPIFYDKRYYDDDRPELVGTEGLGGYFEGEIDLHKDDNSYIITTSNSQDTIESLFPDKDIQFNDGKTELGQDELTTIQEFQLITATSEHTIEATEEVTPETDLDMEFLAPPILRDITQDGIYKYERSELEERSAKKAAKYVEETGNDVGSTPHGQDQNENSVVTRVSNGETHLFPGDIGEDAEQDLLKTYSDTNKLSADVLHAPHHGATEHPNRSGTRGNTEEFLKAVDPEVVVISTGLQNQHGHPDPALFERCIDLDIRMAWTGVSDDISGEDLLDSREEPEYDPKELMKLRCVDKPDGDDRKNDPDALFELQGEGRIDITTHKLEPDLYIRYGYSLEELNSKLVEDEDKFAETEFEPVEVGELTDLRHVGEKTEEKLEKNYSTVEDIAEANPNDLTDINNIGTKKAKSIIRHAELAARSSTSTARKNSNSIGL